MDNWPKIRNGEYPMEIERNAYLEQIHLRENNGFSKSLPVSEEAANLICFSNYLKGNCWNLA